MSACEAPGDHIILFRYPSGQLTALMEGRDRLAVFAGAAAALAGAILMISCGRWRRWMAAWGCGGGDERMDQR